jgi:hypothetical protein
VGAFGVGPVGHLNGDFSARCIGTGTVCDVESGGGNFHGGPVSTGYFVLKFREGGLNPDLPLAALVFAESGGGVSGIPVIEISGKENGVEFGCVFGRKGLEGNQNLRISGKGEKTKKKTGEKNPHAVRWLKG